MGALWRRLRERKLAQWALAYLAGAWLILQVLDLLRETFEWGTLVQQVALVVLAVGFLAALVVAWYHGEKGEQRVTGVEIGMLAALLVLAGAAVAFVNGGTGRPRDAAAPDRQAPSPGPGPASAEGIAVLPLANLSSDAEQEYFSDGVTEDILTKLAQVPGLRVVSRTTVMRYKDTDKSVPEIARELGVRYVLEGSVRRAGERVRITGQLIDARADAHLWADDYDRDLTDVFAVQREIAEAIARALEVELSRGTRARFAAGETADPRAYEFYLRGRELYHRTADWETEEAALRAFRQAVAVDPDYARAWAGLARAYTVSAYFGARPAWVDSARTAAARAIELAPELADGHAALGEILRMQGRNREAMERYRRALELDPNNGVALAEMGQCHAGLGELDEAVRWARRAIAAEPMIPWFHLFLGSTLAVLGEFEAAERSYREAARVEPAHAGALPGYLAEIALRRGRPEEAHAQLASLSDPPIRWANVRGGAHLMLLAGDTARAERLAAGDAPDGMLDTYAFNLMVRAYLLQRAGSHGPAEAELRRAEEVLEPFPQLGLPLRDHYRAALLHALRGDRDAAVAGLRAWRDAGGRDAWLLLHDPLLEPVRGDARVRKIAAELDTILAEQRARLRGDGRE